jgi:hypothetical protein
MDHNFKINEEDSLIQNRKKKDVGGIIGWLMKTRMVSTPGQANALLILFIIIGIAGIIYLNLRTFGG